MIGCAQSLGIPAREPALVGDLRRAVLGVLGERALALLPFLECARHAARRFQRNRERERVHHRGARALAQRRRHGVRRVTNDGDISRRPAAQFCGLISVVASADGKLVDHRRELRKRLDPDIGAQRDRSRLLVGDRGHHRQVQVLLVAGHVEDAQGARLHVPEVDDVIPRARPELVLEPRREHAHDAIAVDVALLQEAEGVPHLGADPVGPDDQVRLELAPVGGDQAAGRRCPGDLGADHDVDSLPPSSPQERRVEMLARHGQHARPLVRRESILGDQSAVVAGLVADRLVRSRDHLPIGAERGEHTQSVLPDKDSRSERPQLAARFVDAHAPAALSECHSRRQARKARAGDFSVTLRAHLRYGALGDVAGV